MLGPPTGSQLAVMRDREREARQRSIRQVSASDDCGLPVQTDECGQMQAFTLELINMMRPYGESSSHLCSARKGDADIIRCSDHA